MDKVENPATYIGIGLGGTGQFLVVDVHDQMFIEDTGAGVTIKLVNPRGLLSVLSERVERLDRRG